MPTVCPQTPHPQYSHVWNGHGLYAAYGYSRHYGRLFQEQLGFFSWLDNIATVLGLKCANTVHGSMRREVPSCVADSQ